MIRTLLACVLSSASLSVAQPAPQPAFEAAAIRPNTTGASGSNWRIHPGGVTVENMSLRHIIQAAFTLQDYQYSGPAWLENERYNIDAKDETKADGKQLVRMLQTLLAERCKLVVHRETRPVSGYALVVAKGGLKIHPAEGEGWSLNSQNRDTRLKATHVNMPRFAAYIARALSQPVVDETKVTGGFDFALEFADPRPGRAESGDGAPPLPSIFTALSEQLGLKLESRKVPVEILVVDRAERPSEN
jgi:uncharacterized protein (TIGR03435 family)